MPSDMPSGMPAWATIALLWVAFAATHMALASIRFRPQLVRRMGERGYGATYSLLALAIFIPLVSCYFGHKHSGPLLWYLGPGPMLKALLYAGMAIAFALMAAGLARPSPASLMPGKTEVSGVLRITRHPLFMGVGIFGALHLLAAPVNAAELAFFGGFPIFAALGCRHQDLRKLHSGGDDFRRFHAETAFFPGGRGGVAKAVREQPIAMGIGVGVAALLRTFHANLFG